MRTLIMAVGLMGLGWSGTGMAQHYDNEMTFKTARSCMDGTCAQVIEARGTIGKETSNNFKRFLSATPDAPAIIVLDSEGGNLGVALRLGLDIRRSGRSTLVRKGQRCFSACTYTFLGGNGRMVEPGALFGVHQFSAIDSDNITSSQASSIAQSLTVHLRNYATLMKVDPDFIDASVSTAPDAIMLVGVAQLQQWNVDNSTPVLQSWEVSPSKKLGAMLRVVQQQVYSDDSAGVQIGRSGSELNTPKMAWVGVRTHFPLADDQEIRDVSICRPTSKTVVCAVSEGDIQLIKTTDQGTFVLATIPWKDLRELRKHPGSSINIHLGDKEHRSILELNFSSQQFDEGVELVAP